MVGGSETKGGRQVECGFVGGNLENVRERS